MIYSGRIQNPQNLDAAEIDAYLQTGKTLTIQFSEASAYAGDILKQVDNLCHAHDERLTIRFYGGSTFDMRTVLRVPHVKSLCVDCVLHVDNVDALAELTHLKGLSLGIYELNKPEILASSNLLGLRRLSISEARKNTINLTPIGEMAGLTELFISGHSRNIDALGRLPKVSFLSLNVGRKVDLGFVNRMKALRQLKLILGGRDDIDELTGDGIEALEIVRARGFSRFDHLPQWRSLKELFIEDQIQLPGLRFSAAMENLEYLRIVNCKTLSVLDKLSTLPKLDHLRVYRTAIDFDDLCRQGIPQSVRQLAFFTGKSKADAALEQRILQMGYVLHAPAT